MKKILQSSFLRQSPIKIKFTVAALLEREKNILNKNDAITISEKRKSQLWARKTDLRRERE